MIRGEEETDTGHSEATGPNGIRCTQSIETQKDIAIKIYRIAGGGRILYHSDDSVVIQVPCSTSPGVPTIEPSQIIATLLLRYKVHPAAIHNVMIHHQTIECIVAA